MSYLVDPEGEFVIDSRRMTIADLSPVERADVHAAQRRHRRIATDAVLGALVIFLVWVAGQVFVGEPTPIDPAPAPAVYVHPEPITE